MSQTIKCSSCGTRYDYADSESCPKCGTYNAPSGNAHQYTVGETGAEKDGSFSESQLLEQFSKLREHASLGGLPMDYEHTQRRSSNRREGEKKGKKERSLGFRIFRTILILLIVTQVILPLLLFFIADIINGTEPIPEDALASSEVSEVSSFPWSDPHEEPDIGLSEWDVDSTIEEGARYTTYTHHGIHAEVTNIYMPSVSAIDEALGPDKMYLVAEVKVRYEEGIDSNPLTIVDVQMLADDPMDPSSYLYYDCLDIDDPEYGWIFSKLPITPLDFSTMNSFDGTATMEGALIFIMDKQELDEVRPLLYFLTPTDESMSSFEDINYLMPYLY